MGQGQNIPFAEESQSVQSWATDTPYGANDEVIIGGNLYTALLDHVSSTNFTADLTAGNWLLVGSTSSSNGYPAIEKFVPALAQTVFTMSGSPTPTIQPILTVNGVEYEKGVNYTISGSTLTWLDTPFTLDASDDLRIYYSN